MASPIVTTPYDRVLEALANRNCRPRARSATSLRALCPVHADRNPSLTVTWKDGRVLMRCWAGCRASDIVLAIGMRMADLFDGPARHVERRELAAYPYVDLDGVLVAEKVRLEPKAFRWRVPSGDGFRWGLHGATPGLYRWPDLLDAGQAFIVEGEKAVEALSAHGFVATCPPAGAGSWRTEWSLDLWRAGCREAVVLADSDRPGREHARKVATACYAVAERPQEPAATPSEPWATWTPADSNVLAPETSPLKVKILELPTVPGGDVVDWFADHSAEDLTAIVTAAPYWNPHEAEREHADRKRALTRERVRRHRERQREARLRTVAVTLRMYRAGGVTRNAVTLPDVLLGTSQIPSTRDRAA